MTRLILTLVAIVCCVSLASCGDARPARYETQGTVTFDGKPLPSGVIRFQPAHDNDLIAPMGYAVIRQGQYKTELGQGSGSGKYLVRITGGDGIPPGPVHPDRKLDPDQPVQASGDSLGSEWFRDYSQEIFLPAENATIDIAVPASAGSTANGKKRLANN